jgi:phosphosulfolactate synthase
MEKRAFSALDIPGPTPKPRDTGITMMCDLHLGVHEQRSILEISGEFIDIAKIATGIAGTIAEDVLRKKIEIYRDHKIDAFLGGMFLEWAIYHKGKDSAKYYFEEHNRLGLDLVEISDNNLEISLEEKTELIRMAREEFGLRVLGEVGTKGEVSSVDDMVTDIKGCLTAGVWKMFVEAAEMTSKQDGSILTDVIEGLQKAVGVRDIIFELSGPWLKNFHYCQVYEMQSFLIETFGPEVNVANVKPDMIIWLEMLRNGLGRQLG